MLMLLTKKELDKIRLDIEQDINIAEYKHHFHPDVRAMIARTPHAPIAYIRDPAPEVRLGLIETNKWLNRIAPNEKNPSLILALIERNIIHSNFARLGSSVIDEALSKIG